MKRIFITILLLTSFTLTAKDMYTIDLTGSIQLTIPLTSIVQNNYISIGPSIRSDFFVFKNWQGFSGLGLSVETELNFDIPTVQDGSDFIIWSLFGGICWQIDINLDSFSLLIKPGFRLGFYINNNSTNQFYEGYIVDCQIGFIFDQGTNSSGFLLIITPAYKIIPYGNNNSLDIKLSAGWRF